MRKPRPSRAPLPADTVPGSDEWRRVRAAEIIRDHTLLTVGANFIPVPIVDSLAVAAVQLRMLASLSRLYGRDFNEDLGRNLLAPIGLGFVHHVFSRHAADNGWRLALGRVPGIGRLLGLAARPALFGCLTHFLGRDCVRHFEAGGQFSDFRAEGLRNTPLAPLALHLSAARAGPGP